MPTAVSAASKDLSRAQWCQRLFHAPHFRVYTTPDTIGVCVSGALKNVIAIASGLASGRGFQNNTRAAIITRGLAEISRIGIALGANPLTFVGLSGVGDLLLTCSSEKSRNFTVGYRLGKGEPLKKIIDTLGSTAEGVATTQAAYKLIKRLNVDAPYVDLIYNCLFGDLSIDEAVKQMATRAPKSELYGWDVQASAPAELGKGVSKL